MRHVAKNENDAQDSASTELDTKEIDETVDAATIDNLDFTIFWKVITQKRLNLCENIRISPL